jgi:hypothetical protein
LLFSRLSKKNKLELLKRLGNYEKIYRISDAVDSFEDPILSFWGGGGICELSGSTARQTKNKNNNPPPSTYHSHRRTFHLDQQPK